MIINRNYPDLYVSPPLAAHPLVYFFQPRGDQISNAFPSPTEKVNPKENTKENNTSNSASGHKDITSELSSRNWDIREVSDMYYVSLDLPGVKQSEIRIQVKDDVLYIDAERKASGTLIAKYAHHFHINRKTMDASKAWSHLEDGVLTIEIPKKDQPKPIDVPVLTDKPPTESESENMRRISFDLPGVKVADLKIKMHDGNIFVDAKRKRGNDVVNINKNVFVDDTHLCVEKSNAFLTDGVLTIIIPRKEEAKKDSSPKQIPFSDCSQVKAAKDSDVEVETVEMET